MEAIFDSHLHLHLGSYLCLLCVIVVVHNCEIDFLCDGCFHIAVNDRPDKVSHPPCNSIESFVFFFKAGKLEFELFIFSQKASGLQFLREGVELCRQIFIAEDFWVRKMLHK